MTVDGGACVRNGLSGWGRKVEESVRGGKGYSTVVVVMRRGGGVFGARQLNIKNVARCGGTTPSCVVQLL